MKSVFSSLWVLPLLQDLCAGLRCLVPALSVQFVQPQQPLVVGTASAVTVCPAPAVVLQGGWSQSFVPSLLLLFVELSWPWPFVAPYPYVFPRLGFFLWRLFRLGFEVLRSCFRILPSFGGGSLSLAFVVLAWLFQHFSFCPGNLGFLDFLAVGFFLSTSSVSLVIQSGLRLMFQFCPVSSLAVRLSGQFFCEQLLLASVFKLLCVALR